jgi:UDP-N-acetylmuramyl tripeptide synthase
MSTPKARSIAASVRLVFVVWVSRLAGSVSRLVGWGRGRTVPGRVALALMPEALGVLAARHRLVLVSGTNGKTTTTLLLTRALGARTRVISNSDGANLTSGLVSTLLGHGKEPAVAVLEVDEVALVQVLAQVRPEVVVLMNLSRDQLDRTSEVRDHLRAWTAAVAGSDGTAIVANADDAHVVAAVRGGRPDGRDVVWVAGGKFFRDDAAVCPGCSAAWDGEALDWHCGGCGLSRPAAAWKLDAQGARVDGKILPLDLKLPGRANASNALMAAAAAHVLGVPAAVALQRMSSVQEVEGRYARTCVEGRELRLLLAKNPAGWIEALEQLEGSGGPVVLSINAQGPDGHDPSWLWDVPLERLRGRLVIATGERAPDLAVRLSYAGVDHAVAKHVRAALALVPQGACDVVANYTAFVAARRELFPAA